MLGLQYFSFTDIWSPIEMLIAAAFLVAYLMLTGPKRSLFPVSEPVPANKKVMFISGVVIYYLAEAGPINLLGHLTFTAHMSAMALAYLVAPPLLLLGLPGWMLRPLMEHKIAGKIIHGLTRPVVSVLAFNAIFSFYHIPLIHDFVMTHFFVHRIYFALLLITALMMWWPVIAPVPARSQLGELKKMAYIFANGVLITPACAVIIFASAPLYDTYNDPQVWAMAMGYCVPAGFAAQLVENFGGPGFFTILKPMEDQQLGGIVMKLMQEIVYGIALMFVFKSWYARERKEDDLDAGTNPTNSNPDPNPMM